MRRRGSSFWETIVFVLMCLMFAGIYFVMVNGLIYVVIFLLIGASPPIITIGINRWMINKFDLDDDVGIKPRFGIIEITVVSAMTFLVASKIITITWLNLSYVFLAGLTLFFVMNLFVKYRRDALDDDQSWMELVLLQNIIGLLALKLMGLITVGLLPIINRLNHQLIMKITVWLASGNDGQQVHINPIVDPNVIIKHCHALPGHWLLIIVLISCSTGVLYLINRDSFNELDFGGISLFRHEAEENPFAVDDGPASGFGAGLSFGKNTSLVSPQVVHSSFKNISSNLNSGSDGPQLRLQKSTYKNDDLNEFIGSHGENDVKNGGFAEETDRDHNEDFHEPKENHIIDSGLIRKPTIKDVGHLVKQGAYWYGTVKSLKSRSPIHNLKAAGQTTGKTAHEIKIKSRSKSDKVPLYDQAHIWKKTDNSYINENGRTPAAIRRNRLKQVMSMYDIQSFNEHAGLKSRGKGVRVGLLRKYDFRCQICGRSPKDSRTNVVLHIDFKNLKTALKYQQLNKVAPWKIPLDALTVVCSRHTPKYFAAQEYLFKHYQKEFKQTQRDMARQRNLRQYIADKFGYQCAYCGHTENDFDSEGNPVKLQLDHIKPVAEGGLTRVDNLQWLCRDCNLSKSDLNLDKKQIAV